MEHMEGLIAAAKALGGGPGCSLSFSGYDASIIVHVPDEDRDDE